MTPERFDVVVVGAGISGIGAGVHLQDKSPDRSFVILESRENIGGTWDLFKYPGVRSDSDMHTLGFEFKPWKADKSIADGPSIMEYLRETVAEHDLQRHMRFGERVVRAEWSTPHATWTVHTTRSDGSQGVFECNYLFMCAGYYSYKSGYQPEFRGLDRFTGQIVHPQQWPDDLDYTDKRVVVIGSGATAVTLVPAMADRAAHVTMLQRSPTYMVSRPDRDAFANFLRKVLPAKLAYNITRAKNTWRQQLVYNRTRSHPEDIKNLLIGGVRMELGGNYPVDKHFTPKYNPWDQRLCLVPNADLFAAIRSGRVSMATDTIETFTETGILLSSGEHLPADVIVTATGLQLVTLGEADFSVDGEPVDFSTTRTYKGMSYSGVPNLATSFGYINASWTLRADLICTYVCRLLNHMRDTGTRQCMPQLRDDEHNMPRRPWIDGFSSGYMQRVMHLMPSQGDREPWINPQNYDKDKKMFREGTVDDGVMQFTNPAATSSHIHAASRVAAS